MGFLCRWADEEWRFVIVIGVAIVIGLVVVIGVKVVVIGVILVVVHGDCFYISQHVLILELQVEGNWQILKLFHAGYIRIFVAINNVFE